MYAAGLALTPRPSVLQSEANLTALQRRLFDVAIFAQIVTEDPAETRQLSTRYLFPEEQYGGADRAFPRGAAPQFQGFCLNMSPCSRSCAAAPAGALVRGSSCRGLGLYKSIPSVTLGLGFRPCCALPKVVSSTL